VILARATVRNAVRVDRGRKTGRRGLGDLVARRHPPLDGIGGHSASEHDDVDHVLLRRRAQTGGSLASDCDGSGGGGTGGDVGEVGLLASSRSFRPMASNTTPRMSIGAIPM
jgi:hypothetical protein